MAGGSEQAPDALVPRAATAGTLADLAGLLRDLRQRHARRRAGAVVSYRELAARTGWSHAAIGEYFTGRALPPTDRFDAIVALLGADPTERRALAAARDRVEENHRRDRASGASVGSGARVAGESHGAGGSPVAGGSHAGGTGPQGKDPVPEQLPADVPAFAGRPAELARLDALLEEGGRVRAVLISALFGMAGVGKTALALHWAHRVADRFPDGQLYVNLRGFDPTGQVLEPADALRRFLDALGVAPRDVPATLDAWAALYRSHLADKHMLIVLDNARDTAQVRPLLPGAPTCLVLVTSRNQLTGLVAVDGAQPIALDLLPAAEARELLTRRLGTDRVDAEPDAVDAIVTACARLPLALAIVAARAATRPRLPLAVLARELRHAQDRLRTLTGDDPAADVRAVFSWSYRALDPPAARMFRLLGLHPGPDVTAPAAASLAATAAERARALLAELARVNLLSEHLPGRYALHDLLRAYAAELTAATDPDDERRDCTRRILDHYLHTGYRAARLVYPTRDPITLTLGPAAPGVTPEPLADDRQAMAWFTAERPVLLAAVQHAAATCFDTQAWQLASTLTTFLDRRGHWQEWAAVQTTAVAAARRLGDPAAQANAHRNLAGAYGRLGRFAEAHAELRHALDLYSGASDLVGQAYVHYSVALMCELEGDVARALGHDRQALDLFRAAGHRPGQALALNAVGWDHAQLGDHPRALDACVQALTLLQDLGDRNGQAATWDSLGYTHHHLGDHAQAVTCYGHALKLFRDLGNRYLEAGTLTRLGDTHLAAGDPGAARDAWRAAVAILDDLGHPDADRVRTKLTTIDGTPAD